MESPICAMSRIATACASTSRSSANADPHRWLNNLFKHTAMQVAFNMNMLASSDGQPQTLSLKAFYSTTSTTAARSSGRRTEFDLEKARARAAHLEGLKIALDNLETR